jgi:hypothetical protein
MDVNRLKLEHRDYGGREPDAVILVPDDVARELRRWKRDTWTEIYGCATGYTEKATGRIAEYLAAICDFAAAHVPAQPITGTVKAFIIGESGLEEFRHHRNPDVLYGPNGLMVATPYCLSRTEISG